MPQCNNKFGTKSLSVVSSVHFERVSMCTYAGNGGFHIVMALLETYLLNAPLCHNISVPIGTIRHWGSAREPKFALY